MSNFPFIHYLVRSENRGKTTLVSPKEESFLHSGEFFIPIQDNGDLFSQYEFHYMIYLGKGEFVQEQGINKVFTGMAISATIKNMDTLTLLFGPHAKDKNGELFIPILERMPRKKPVKYTGIFKNKDFDYKFVELYAPSPDIFEKGLEKYGISMLGCNTLD